MENISTPLDSVDAVADIASTTTSDYVQNMDRDDEKAEETTESDFKEMTAHVLGSGDVSDAIPGHSSATLGDDDSNNKEKEQQKTKETSIDDKEAGGLSNAIMALHLTSSDDTPTDRIYENAEPQGTPADIPKTDDLGDSSSNLAVPETRSTEKAQKLKKNRLAARKLPSDISVPLRPEGVFAEDGRNDTSPTSRVRFTDEATLRGYERGSRPSPTFQPSSSPALNHQATGVFLGNATRDLETVQAADVEDKLRLMECEEELNLLEGTLPKESQDLNSVKFTKLVIESARNAVKQAHEAMREGCESEEPMDFALYMTVQAHGFHEEALRLVNGQDKSSDIHEFERRILFEDEQREKMRNRNAGALPDDYFDDVSDA